MQTGRITLMCFALLLALVLVSATLAAASNQTSMPIQETPGILPGEAPWVVRAYYSNPEVIQRIAAWTEPWEVNRADNYLVLEVNFAEYTWLVDNGLRVIFDAERTAELHTPLQYLPDQATGIPGFPCYRTVAETYDLAASLAASYPQFVEWLDIGDSWEKETPAGQPGYDLRLLRLTNQNIPAPKPAVFIMSSVHARELTPAELNTRFAQYLLENYQKNADVTWLLDYYDLHLLLLANPDGRLKAEQGLSWRKNTDSLYCPDPNSWGIDLNRNFSFAWNCCGGSSGNACNATYRGPAAASEPETRAIQDYVRANFPDQRAADLNSPAPDDASGIFLDIHSFGELVIWPWGFTNTLTGNGAALQTLGRKLAYFNDYWPEQAISLYPTDGTTDDFAYGELGLAAFAFELGTSFTQDCATFENEILPDNLAALLYMTKAARAPYLLPAGPEIVNLHIAPQSVGDGETISVTALADDGRFSQQNGSEPVQAIQSVEYSLDVPPWLPAANLISLPPADGAYNAPQEMITFEIDSAGLSPGKHTLYMQAQDASNNWGTVSAEFFYLAPLEPTAGFTYTLPVYQNRAVQFTNLSVGSPGLTYYWNFGIPQATSTAVEPFYVYTEPGAYTVTLTVTNSLGSDSLSRLVNVQPLVETYFPLLGN